MSVTINGFEELRAFLIDYVGIGRQILTDDRHPWQPNHVNLNPPLHCRFDCGHLFGSSLLGEIESCSEERLIDIAKALNLM